MTREEKELLLKDLCVRSHYGVICQFIWTYSNETTDGEDVIAKENDNIRCIDIHTKKIQADYYGEWVDLEHCRPYLRPLSSMTEEEKKELSSRYNFTVRNERIQIRYHSDGYWDDDTECPTEEYLWLFDWLNEHHFDYRGLIPMGLALEAKKEMYKTE